jgi:hypothetical protein
MVHQSEIERLARLESKVEAANDRVREQAAATVLISSNGRDESMTADARVELCRARVELQM